MTSFDVSLVGEFNVDLLLYGLPENLPLERELLADRMALLLGGSPAITAHNLSALGNRVALIAPSSKDMFAGLCLAELSSVGVDLSRIVQAPPGIATGITVLLQHQSSRRTLTYAGATATLRFEDLDLDYLRSARHFHLSSPFLQKQLLADIPRLFAELKQSGLTISLDTNDDPDERWSGPIRESLRYVDVLMPNAKEACALSGKESPEAALRKLLEYVPTVVIKQGPCGATASDGNQLVTVPGLNVRSIDAVGAGDSFNAGFLHGYLRHWPLQRCLEYGNAAGALSTTEIGGTAAFRDHSAMRQFLESYGTDAPTLA